MPIEVENLVKIGAGSHVGIVTDAQIVNRTFEPQNGPQKRLAITIQPKSPAEGTYRAQEVLFSPSLNPLSGLGALLKRLNREPSYKTAKTWDESSLIGTEVQFEIEYPVDTRTGETSQFPRIVKETITAA